ncbi:phosphotransferase [Amycolatopsis plumensis]|uniref:Phosphotransferase n=1 Tax=Amycolatopsis plumensis TaxID=236508 RepID=A0ABV5UMJ4_9PSEU
MTRFKWHELPDVVRESVQSHLGPVTVVRHVEQGQNCNLALVLRSEERDVFLKGVRGVSPQMRWLRNEVEAGPLAPGVAPAACFSEDVDADALWFVAGFEYLNGRPADLSPESDDLNVVRSVLAKLNSLSGGSTQPLTIRWAKTDWWQKFAVEAPERADGLDIDELTAACRHTPELVGGDALLHTDLHEHQFMIDGDSVRVIDWGRPASGAPWVDTAFMVVRLIAAGFEPREAEVWGASVPRWSTGTEHAVTAFACYVAGLWAYRAVTTPFPGATRLSDAATAYAHFRLAR